MWCSNFVIEKKIFFLYHIQSNGNGDNSSTKNDDDNNHTKNNNNNVSTSALTFIFAELTISSSSSSSIYTSDLTWSEPLNCPLPGCTRSFRRCGNLD